MNEKRIQQVLEIEKQAKTIHEAALHEAEQLPVLAEKEAQALIEKTRQDAQEEARRVVARAQAESCPRRCHARRRFTHPASFRRVTGWQAKARSRRPTGAASGTRKPPGRMGRPRCCGATAALEAGGGWGGVADEAAEAGFRLIGIDRPGYGLSTPWPGRSIVDWVPDGIAVADHLGIGRFVAVGVSTGGAYVLALAALHPDRVPAWSCAAHSPTCDGRRVPR